MKKTRLISFAVLFVMVGQATADWGWPPSDTEIVPQNPTSSDVVAITLGGVWGDSCIPNVSNISVMGNDIYFDVFLDYPPFTFCLTVITSWDLTEYVGPLPIGTYSVYVSLDGGAYERLTDLTVADKQFVLSTESVTVPEGGIETFTVALLLEPAGTVEASVTHQSGDPDITVQSGGTLFFDPSNYSVPQTVTLAASEDMDILDGTALIQVTAPEYLTAEVTATEADNDDRYVLYVDVDAPGVNTGTSWLDAFTDLQDALSVAAAYPDIEEIRVAQGTYRPAESNGSRSATFQLINGLAVKGDYAGFGEPDPDARSVNAYKTILSGDLNGNDIGDLNDPSRNDNCYKVVKGDHVNKTAVLDGFIVTAGNGDKGAGIYVSGGLGPIISNCIISGNRASTWGGGIYNRASTEIADCILIGNSANLGGGIYSYAGSPKMINCTFSSNSADGNGGGLYVRGDGGNPKLTNCILWANTDSGGQDESAQAHINYTYESTTTFNYCCIQGWTGSLEGINNIDTAPCFADPCSGDYHLLPGSPCIDAGDPNYIVEPNETDLDGKPRVIGGRIDMGAYEYANTAPVACIVGGDRIVECGGCWGARVTLDGSCSSDSDSAPGTNDDIVSFDWYKVDACDPNFEDFIGSGEIIDCNLPLGEHIIALEVIDKAGAFDTNEVTIIVQDTTPPDFTLSVTPTMLWPVNHKMVLITPSWTASDICDDSPDVSLVSITMNEGDEEKGDGHTADDIQIGDDGSIYLRAERTGTGSGRIYTITYQAVDDSGNVAVASATVTVPHDQR